VYVNTSEEGKGVAGTENAREQATPSNPTIYFFNSS